MVIETALNFLFGNTLLYWAWLLVPLVLPVLSFRKLHRHPTTIRYAVSTLLAASAGLFCFFVPLSWILRDGLGPDSIESHAGEAVSRFIGLSAPALLVSSVICGVAILLYGISERKLRRAPD